MRGTLVQTMKSLRLRAMLSAILVVAAVVLVQRSAHADAGAIRAAWLSRADIESADAVRRAVSTAATSGVDTLVVPASLFSSPDGSFDGLAEAVRVAHARGLHVHASIDINRVSAVDEVPGARTNLLYEHPDWLMIPRALAPELLALDVRSPNYVGRLARWTRANAARVGGLYVSPLFPDAIAQMAAAVERLVGRYMVDGVELEEAQYPGEDFDYSRSAMERFRADLRPRLTAAEQQRMDRVEALDPFAYADEFPDEWRRFRQSSLTALVTRVRTAVKASRPTVVVSAVVSEDAAAAVRDHLQDWRTWLDNGFIDAISRRSGATGTIATTYEMPLPVNTVSAVEPGAAFGSR